LFVDSYYSYLWFHNQYSSTRSYFFSHRMFISECRLTPIGSVQYKYCCAVIFSAVRFIESFVKRADVSRVVSQPLYSLLSTVLECFLPIYSISCTKRNLPKSVDSATATVRPSECVRCCIQTALDTTCKSIHGRITSSSWQWISLMWDHSMERNENSCAKQLMEKTITKHLWCNMCLSMKSHSSTRMSFITR
jgi:hypothetical protein